MRLNKKAQAIIEEQEEKGIFLTEDIFFQQAMAKLQIAKKALELCSQEREVRYKDNKPDQKETYASKIATQALKEIEEYDVFNDEDTGTIEPNISPVITGKLPNIS